MTVEFPAEWSQDLVNNFSNESFLIKLAYDKQEKPGKTI